MTNETGKPISEPMQAALQVLAGVNAALGEAFPALRPNIVLVDDESGQALFVGDSTIDQAIAALTSTRDSSEAQGGQIFTVGAADQGATRQ